MSGRIEISRKLIERAACNLTSSSDAYKIQQELLEALAAPVVERQEPVMKLEAERLWNGDGEYAVSFVKAGWLDECRKTGGTFLLYTSPPAPVAVVLPEPMPITEGMNRLMDAYRLGEFRLEGGSPTVEAMSCASYDNSETAMRDHDFDSYAAGYQAAMYEEAKSLLGHIACLDKVKELNQ